jgi:microcystin-dependent protein
LVNPRTVNTGIIVPLTGADVDLWGELDVNPNMVAIDGMFGGIQTIAVTNVPVTLTSPAGFVATPTPGPTQAQNRVLRFTGALSGNVGVTLPLPGVYVIENLTTGNFILFFQSLIGTETISIDQGARQTIYNDGANVRFVDMPRVGAMEFWAGVTALPAWALNCTVKPFLACDGTVYNFSQYPYLAQRLLGQFGGNGVTTFAVPDLRGRVPLAYDGTAARITVAGSGLNGQQLGAALDKQTNTLVSANLPPYTPAGTLSGVANSTETNVQRNASNITPVGGGSTSVGVSNPGVVTINGANFTFTGAPAPGQISSPVNNVQPSLMTGIWVIKT